MLRFAFLLLAAVLLIMAAAVVLILALGDADASRRREDPE